MSGIDSDGGGDFSSHARIFRRFDEPFPVSALFTFLMAISWRAPVPVFQARNHPTEAETTVDERYLKSGM